ncbi:hypothetical protein BH20ACT3_BH20ACT3_12730 [soil metagenome]
MHPAPQVPAAAPPPAPQAPGDGGEGSRGGLAAAPIVVSRAAIIAMGCFVGATVISQVTSLKIGVVLGRAVDMGTFIYPITFTLRDLVHKTAGRSAARTMIVTAALVNVFLAAYLAFTVQVESDADWGLGQAYADVLGPIWRIVAASIVAMVIAELINTEVYHWWVTKVTRRFQWLRVLVSNGLSLPVDNALFAVLAFASLPMLRSDALGWATVWDIFLVNLVVKFAVSVVSVPMIYLVKDRNLPEEDPSDVRRRRRRRR